MKQFTLAKVASVISIVLPLTLHAADQKISPDDLQFFESRIRPILADNCYKCHSQNAEKVKGGLLVDNREAMLKGGNTGPAVVPGDLEKSLIIQAVHYKDKDLQMPPNDRKLSDSQIADLEDWVRRGAPDPRKAGDAPHDYKIDLAKAKQHWAFQPISNPTPPSVADPKGWSKTPIDKFILAKLTEKGLAPSPMADKVTLIRRATFDLTGLPPTLKEVDAFLADDSSDAFTTVVDRLLASDRYGERWGRYWLDLCHYADTKGPVNNGRDSRYIYSYTFRDYVIRSLNEDKPYDRFLLEQIAADKIVTSDDKRPLAALGYLTLGNRFNNQINDIIDDRIDLLCKSTMALTVNCARCHDHKFDPILQKDYYSLHGIFSSCTEPKEGPLLEPVKDTPLYHDYLRQVEAAEAVLETFKFETGRELALERNGKSGDYMLALHDYKNMAGTNKVARNVFIQRKGLVPQTAAGWDNVLKAAARKHNPILAPWLAFESLDASSFVEKARELSTKFYENSNKTKPLNPLVARMFATPPSSLLQVAARYNSLFMDIEKRWQSTMVAYENHKKMSGTAVPMPDKLEDATYEEARQVLYAKNSPLNLDERRLADLINRDNKLRNKLATLERAVNDVKATHPGSPARAPVLEDADRPRDSYVFLRGNPGSRGPVVKRQFIQVLAGESPSPFKQGSGRLELAKSIATPENPLTARVAVNRVWLHHFGDGLVKTPDDFGTRSEPPTNPELLDYLASRFIQDGWSMKKLHRLIMLSSVYQQSSDDNPRFAQIDPNNIYYWQMNRRRLDFEALRDSILYIGGKLDTTMYGPPVKLNSEPYSTRRTVYGFVDRGGLPNMFLAFDFANPDLTTGKRDNTIVPQQALFMMNSALVVEQGRDLVRRPDFKALARDEDKLNLLYRLIYQRKPSEMERTLAFNYLRSEANPAEAGSVGDTPWEYGYGHFDGAARRVKDFNRMTSFDGRVWQLPLDPKKPRLGMVRLSADGGLTSEGLSAVRRWTAPRDGMISIEAMLACGNKAGNGIVGRIVSSQSGLLGTWTAAKGVPAATRLPRLVVHRGETIDFLAECRNAPKGENFAWSPVIRMGDVMNKAAHLQEWSAKAEFSDASAPKRLGGWEKFAQVLL
ncbi:MAG TPA: PSD1 and planctomycete cytochrome C domain-containing protein, partial [Verrucomicrobiae bacterium]